MRLLRNGSRPSSIAGAFLLALLAALPSGELRAQEGRPALPAETAEDQRIKTAIRDALPRAFDRWAIDREADVNGTTWFHGSNEAATAPFTHEFSIRYVYQPTDVEREAFRRIAVDTAGIRQMQDDTECDIAIGINTFDQEVMAAAALDATPRAPFTLSLMGSHGGRVYLGPWKIATNEALDGTRRRYHVVAVARGSNTAVQTIAIAISGSPRVVSLFLSRINTAALSALVGSDPLAAATPASARNAVPIEKPLSPAPPGQNEISFTLDGGDLHARAVRMKPSVLGQFAYLNNNHPNRAITDNAVTRVLAQEDDDFTTKNKTAFFDLTIPFIRRLGVFAVSETTPKATLAGGVNCWEGCEWSFTAQSMTVEITRYDAVNGFVEGTFSGAVTLKYRASEPVDHRDTTAQITNGHFKVRRQADR